MSFIARSVSRILPATQQKSSILSRTVLNSAVAANRTFTQLTQNVPSSNKTCHVGCFCCVRGLHTKGDQQLVSFLQEEIHEEKKNLAPKIPSELDGFTVKVDKAHVHLYRKFHDEEINVHLYINHSVDAVNDPATMSGQEGEEAVQLSCKPDFEVDVVAGGRTMSFSCSYSSAEEQDLQQEGQEEEVFGIGEILMREAEDEEHDYAASGEIMDEQMYGMMMGYLAERGVTDDFVLKLSELCYDYEHSQYVNLLQGVHDFIARK